MTVNHTDKTKTTRFANAPAFEWTVEESAIVSDLTGEEICAVREYICLLRAKLAEQ